MTEQQPPIDHPAIARAALACLTRTHHQEDIPTGELIGDAHPHHVVDYMCMLTLQAFRQGGYDIDRWLTDCGIAFADGER